MPALSEGSPDVLRINAVIGNWHQGDPAFDEHIVVHLGDPDEPLTEATAETADWGLQPIASEVDGLMVVTQTCDIVR